MLNNYTCTCGGNFTGRNCEIEINYCTENKPCFNGATCVPKKDRGTEYICQCPPGFAGVNCQTKTTFNLRKKGHWNVTATTPSAIQLSFRTTVDGLLMIFHSTATKYYIYLSNGNIVLKQDSGTRTIQLPGTNGQWHQLKAQFGQQGYLNITNYGSLLAVNIEGVNLITVGGNQEQVAPNFVGCMRDLMINDNFYSESEGVHTGLIFGDCVKNDSCSSNSCEGHGTCIDKWITSSCVCYRQYFGESCQYGNNLVHVFLFLFSVFFFFLFLFTLYCFCFLSTLEIEAFSFQLSLSTNSTHANRRKRRSVSTNYVKAIPNHRLNATHGLSFLIRTRQKDGFVAIMLNREPANTTDTRVSYVLVELQNRYLKVAFKEAKAGALPQTLVNASSGLMVSNGKWTEVHITSNAVQVGNQLMNLTTPISLMVSLVLLGGTNNPALYSTITNTAEFLGCLQAVNIGAEFLTNQLISGDKTVSVEQALDVGSGCPGGPVCQENSCLFNGQCVDEWYDFSCNCQQGYGGKTCSDFGCGLNNTCSSRDRCIDVPVSNPPATSCKFLVLKININMILYSSLVYGFF